MGWPRSSSSRNNGLHLFTMSPLFANCLLELHREEVTASWLSDRWGAVGCLLIVPLFIVIRPKKSMFLCLYIQIPPFSHKVSKKCLLSYPGQDGIYTKCSQKRFADTSFLSEHSVERLVQDRVSLA